MAGFKLLLSQSRHLSLSRFSSFHFLSLHRFLSSSSSSSQSLLIQPVSYAPKPKDPPQPQHPDQAPQGWSREDLRYVKDMSNISPVSYPARVAPLPEDRLLVSGQDGEVRDEGSEEMAREGQRIQADARVWRRPFRIAAEEEKIVVPFPMLIMPEKKKENRHVLDLMDAIREVKANAKANFDETVEAHVRLGIDQKRSELIVRGTMTLPHGVKKEVRVAVFAEGIDADEARAAGADIVGGVELIEEIASTVTKDVTKAVKEAKQGQVKFRMDKTSIVHVGIGKASLSEEFLRDNVGGFMNSLLQAKPAGLKKTSKYAGYVNSFHVCSTMGPGFRVSIQSLSRAADHYSKVYLNA